MTVAITVPIPRTSEGWSVMDDNFEELQSFVNDLAQQILAVSGDGAQLLLDLFDRPGIVGTHSYVLDLENYEGGSEIVIGRRPEANEIFGELNISIAFGIFAGLKKRVQQPGDVTLDASPITSGLPKTIYVGIGAAGTAQLFPDQTTPDVLYIYSMCWDGFQLTQSKRLGHFLPAYSLLQLLAKLPREIAVYDRDTQWKTDAQADVRIPLHGSAISSGVAGLDLAAEIIGGYVDVPKGGLGAFHCPGGTANKLVLRFMLNGVKVNLGTFEINVSNAPDRIYFTVDADALGSDRFVTSVSHVSIERVSVGADVVSARGCSYGLFVRPVLGILDTVQEVRDLPDTLRRIVDVLVLSKGKIYSYVSSSRETDDGVTWLEPTDTSCDCCKNRGRWMGQGLGGGSGDDSDDVILPIEISDVTGLEDALAAVATLPIAEGDVTDLVSDLGTLSSAISSEAGTRAAADAAMAADIVEIETDLGELVAADAAEATARAAADTAEATARADADTAEAFSRAMADSAEASARAALASRIDALPNSLDIILASQVFGG